MGKTSARESAIFNFRGEKAKGKALSFSRQSGVVKRKILFHSPQEISTKIHIEILVEWKASTVYQNFGYF